MAGRSKDVAPYGKFVACTPGATAFPTCRGVIATVAGTITGTDADGNTVTALPVIVGYNPYQFSKITAATATGLFLGY
jgi:hypothetical protein